MFYHTALDPAGPNFESYGPEVNKKTYIYTLNIQYGPEVNKKRHIIIYTLNIQSPWTKYSKSSMGDTFFNFLKYPMYDEF